MKTNKGNFCNFFMFLSICLIIYISIDTYIRYFYMQDIKIDENSYIFKIVFLSILFIVIALIFTFFKIYKKFYLQKELDKKTNDILHENETLKIYSHIDPLTQCLNKKYFLDRYEEEFKRAVRQKEYLSLLVVNIDEFKAFNDIYGENEGDECIKIIANILVNHCNRPVDLVSRFEEDIFYVLLPNTKEPLKVANNCLESVRKLNIPHENSIASHILTITIGVATILATNIIQKDQLLLQANEALKQAKKAGRNRVQSL